MTVYEHNPRARIFNPAQHPFKHTLEDFAYTNSALPGVTTLQAALDWMFTVMYPRTQDPVDTPGDLPSVGNTIGDYRVVTDDGDTKAAGYQWQQREGDVAAKWYKVSDMDWGVPTILSEFLLKTQDVYVYRYGYDDVDDEGAALTGDDAGQHIYGGASANTHLTLWANSGDGTGPATGYVQLGDNARPLVDSSLSLGTTGYRFLKGWFDELQGGTLVLTAGSITDSSGAIDFGDENLSTTGTLSAGQITGTALLATGSSILTLDGGSITDSSGAIDFGDEDLSTSGSVAPGTLLLAAGSITDSSGAIDFGDEALTTSGGLSAGVITGTQLNVDSVRVDGSTISVTVVDGSLTISANGAGVVNVTYPMTTIGQTVTGTLAVTGQLDVDNLRFDGNTISSTNADGSILLDPNGTGGVLVAATFFGDTDGAYDLGADVFRFNKLFLDNAISDGTEEITIANLLTFRAVGTPSTGDALFWDGSKWVASAPDTEVDHGSVSGLGDDDHTQYGLLLGRSGGQTLIGGTDSGDDLTLTSTSHGTKGDIVFASRLWASADNTWDVGDSTHRIKDLYIAGQAYGLRVQNATTAGKPSASASTIGRLYYDTDVEFLFVDTGGAWKKVSSEKHILEDASGWTGSETSAVYTVSADVSDARLCLWAFYSNSDTFAEVAGAVITKSETQVTVTVASALPAGTYTLIGLG